MNEEMDEDALDLSEEDEGAAMDAIVKDMAAAAKKMKAGKLMKKPISVNAVKVSAEGEEPKLGEETPDDASGAEGDELSADDVAKLREVIEQLC